MRLLIRMTGSTSETITLPINYRPLIHGMIYRMLSPSEEFAAEMHASDNVQGRSYKGFTFSPLFGAHQVEGHRICFVGLVGLEIRSIDPVMIALLYHSVMSAREIHIGNETLQVIDCHIDDRHIHEKRIKIRTVAPVVVYSTDETNHSHFFSPLDAEFYNLIQGNARRKGAFFRLSAPFEISLSLLPGFRPQKQISTFKQTILEGWFAIFWLEGTPEYLDLLYQTGLGSKNTEGFGMFEVLDR